MQTHPFDPTMLDIKGRTRITGTCKVCGRAGYRQEIRPPHNDPASLPSPGPWVHREESWAAPSPSKAKPQVAGQQSLLGDKR
jgi:hypothetical protein